MNTLLTSIHKIQDIAETSFSVVSNFLSEYNIGFCTILNKRKVGNRSTITLRFKGNLQEVRISLYIINYEVIYARAEVHVPHAYYAHRNHINNFNELLTWLQENLR